MVKASHFGSVVHMLVFEIPVLFAYYLFGSRWNLRARSIADPKCFSRKLENRYTPLLAQAYADCEPKRMPVADRRSSSWAQAPRSARD